MRLKMGRSISPLPAPAYHQLHFGNGSVSNKKRTGSLTVITAPYLLLAISSLLEFIAGLNEIIFLVSEETIIGAHGTILQLQTLNVLV